MTFSKRIVTVVAVAAAVGGPTLGLTRHSSAYDIISQLGLDAYATEIAGDGIALWPTSATPPITHTQAIQTCGASFPTPLPKAAVYAHVHITGFGWGPVGALDQDAWVFSIEIQSMQGPAGTEHISTPSIGHHPPLDGQKDAFVLWFEGIPDPAGHPCWGFGGGPGPT